MRIIPPTLQEHLDSDGTTVCFLLRVTCRDGSVLAVTSLDQPVIYDDGAGEVTYSAAIGMNQSAVDSTSNLEVDNSEAQMLLSDAGVLTPEKINAGILDYARFVIYRTSWEGATQTTTGLRLIPERHYITQTGTTGAVRQHEALMAVVELRGLPQQLKQNYGELYSLTCRAIFGSGGGGGGCISRGQCGFDAVSLWQSHTVDVVDVDDPDLVFTADSTPAVNGPGGALLFVPGLIKWTTGANAGLFSEIEEHDGTSLVLRLGTYYPIVTGDAFDIRPDCDKTWETCRDKFANNLNFRGEPKIPLTDETSQSAPNFRGVWSSGAGTEEFIPP